MADDASTAQRVAQAWHLFAAGDLAGAIAQARAALSSHPAQPAGSAALGFFLIEAGELNDAAAVLLPACEQAPGHAPLHWYVGYLLQRRGDTMGAAAAFEHACRLDASLDEAAFALAWALNDLGRVEEALGWSLRALESARTPHRMLQSAWLFQATQQYERAVTAYREAIEAFAPAAPEQPRLHLHLSQCLRQLHQDKAADVVLRHALDTWPHVPDLSLESGWQLRARGDLHGALHQARALVGEHPHEARAWHLQGVLLQELGELKAADQAFAETHQRDPALTDALLRRAEIQRGWKQYAGARWLLGLVSERHPDHATAQNLLAQVLLDEGDTDGARRILVRRLRADARSPDLWRLLATVHSRRGHSRLALRLLCRARALSPGDVGTLRMLGWLALEQGDVPWAVQVVSDLV
jgi:tetratricopeptide (TPR) repeat protein